MHRVRTLLDELGKDSGKKMIYYKSGAYGWNDELKCSVDTELFEQALQRAADADNGRKLEFLLQAIHLYVGHFLQKNGSESWIMQISNKYNTSFLQAASEAAAILFDQGQYEELINVCRHVVKLNPYEEEFYIYLLAITRLDNHQYLIR